MLKLCRQIIIAVDVATCTDSYLCHNPTTLSKVVYRRFVDHGGRACNTTGQTIRMCSSTHMQPTYQRGSDGPIWGRSSDGPFWRVVWRHEKRGGREHPWRGRGIDKCHAALISSALSTPACPAQSDTHVWCWSAGAYPIVDIESLTY